MSWKVVKQENPPKEQLILTKIDDKNGERNIARLSFDGKLWWLPNKSMYVYYTPTHWWSNN